MASNNVAIEKYLTDLPNTIDPKVRTIFEISSRAEAREALIYMSICAQRGVLDFDLLFPESIRKILSNDQQVDLANDEMLDVLNPQCSKILKIIRRMPNSPPELANNHQFVSFFHSFGKANYSLYFIQNRATKA